jgi:ATP-dependent helicase HrpA
MGDTRIDEIRRLLPQCMLADWVRLGSRLVRLVRDQKHTLAHTPVLERLLVQARASVALREKRHLQKPLPTYPSGLPITARKDEIVSAIRSHQVVIVAGETGSGKTTQIPKMCLEAGLGIEAKIGCTQPRRVAALSISRRIAQELQVDWGREVGCKIRFDDHASPETYIKIMTDGILLAETQGDPLLSDYNALIIDEAHERSLNIDFLLGYLKGLLAKRAELKLVITSATIDTETFSRAFNGAPVFEVSGRVFAVELVYAPLDSASEESGETTYIDAAVQATRQVLSESREGDVLVFMPGERDIRETSDLLKGGFSDQAEIIPLFGRLASGEQQRVFVAGTRRKIVVATNIAETSLTIPGIRYVIDSGLARISRYNPHARTKRLPIEPIARSSADQRKGRCGRVQNGVCIRLYSEQDFAARAPYTPPEIQRANLAEVILRMTAFRLGEIESFPFIDPPTPAAIQAGYRLLQELGALDETRALTVLGSDLARLPIDPTLGRMLLQAQREHATREMLIIASGLSIQDPRERPFDQKEAAAAAHKRFAHPQSDFLTLLNIWDAVHEQWETLRTQNQRRKFCKANFLSYVRMREWQDLHARLHDALDELGTLRINESNAAYDAIHRSILAGLLGHIALKTERNIYTAAGKRQVVIFPGSVLSLKSQPGKRHKQRMAEEDPNRSTQPEWIVAGEIVETTRLFARTVAGIDPLWILDLGSHLCRVAHQNPRWDRQAGRVLVEERTTLYGLEIRRRNVAYGNVNPKEATELFVRAALVEEDLLEEEEDAAERVTGQKSKSNQLEFLEHNKRVRQKIEVWQTQMRHGDLVDLDEAFFKFYSQRIQNVSSLDELNRMLRDEPKRKSLLARESDLIGEREVNIDMEAFPNEVALAGQALPVSYAYAPGEDNDGVTIAMDLGLASAVSPAAVEWAVPGLREAQITELLRTLPKGIRRQLMPFPPKVAEILRELRPATRSLKHDLAEFITRRYGVSISASTWAGTSLPQHMRPRVEILDGTRKTVAAGRDLAELQQKLEKVTEEASNVSPVWDTMAQKWERFGLTGWTFGDLPERISSEQPGRSPLEAWFGLELEDGHVNVRLYARPDLARESSLRAVQRLVELELQKDLGWIQKDLRALSRCGHLFADLCPPEDLQAAAYANLRRHLLPSEPFPQLCEKHFRAAVSEARAGLPGLASRLTELIELIFKLRQEILHRYGARIKPQAGQQQKRVFSDLAQLGAAQQTRKPNLVETELERLLPMDFLERVPFNRLAHMPRYLKAVLIRAERATLNPVKDKERERQLEPFIVALREAERSPRSKARSQLLEEYRWMIEEFRVSLFAQELGTSVPISAKRLAQQLERIGASMA